MSFLFQSEKTSPPCITVSQKAFEMGRVAAQRLIESKYPMYEMETRRLDAKIVWNVIDKTDGIRPVNNNI